MIIIKYVLLCTYCVRTIRWVALLLDLFCVVYVPSTSSYGLFCKCWRVMECVWHMRAGGGGHSGVFKPRACYSVPAEAPADSLPTGRSGGDGAAKDRYFFQVLDVHAGSSKPKLIRSQSKRTHTWRIKHFVAIRLCVFEITFFTHVKMTTQTYNIFIM